MPRVGSFKLSFIVSLSLHSYCSSLFSMCMGHFPHIYWWNKSRKRFWGLIWVFRISSQTGLLLPESVKFISLLLWLDCSLLCVLSDFAFFCVTGSFYRIILPSDFFPAGTFYRLVMCWSDLWCLKIGNYCNAVLICRQKNCLFSLLSLTLRVFFGFVKRTVDCFPIFCINAVIGLYKYNFYCPIFISCLAASGNLSFFGILAVFRATCFTSTIKFLFNDFCFPKLVL